MRRDVAAIASPARPIAGIGPTAAQAATRIHASCVQMDGVGVLVLGPSGSGKSDLALRLVDAGAQLVADDQVVVERHGEQLLGRAPAAISGLLEVRSFGIVRLPCCAVSPLGLVVQLDLEGPGTRLPCDPARYSLLGIELPRVRLDPRMASACAKIRVALRAERIA